MIRVDEDPSLLDRTIWTDEASFNLSGTVNRHNAVCWSQENPHESIQKMMKSKSITVLGGICSSGVYGPYFFEGTVTGGSFLKIMEKEMLSGLERTLDAQRLWFQLDGAPGHWATKVRSWLDGKFPERWIGRGGPVAWPPRSPDLTPPDFFLWGYIKNLAYANSPDSIDSLKVAIVQAFSTITVSICDNVCQSVYRRLQRCVESDGAQIK